MSLLVEPTAEEGNEIKQHPLRQTWTKFSLLSVFSPWMIYLLFHYLGEEGDGDGVEGGQDMMIFAYLGSLLLFIVIYLNGTAFLTESDGEMIQGWYVIARGVDDAVKSAKNLGLMVGALVVFSCFSFLFFLVTFVAMMDFTAIEELKSSLGRRTSIIPVTFLYWSILCAWLALKVFRLDPINYLADQKENDTKDTKTESEIKSVFPTKSNEDTDTKTEALI